MNIKKIYRNCRMIQRRIWYEIKYRTEKEHSLNTILNNHIQYTLFVTNDNEGGTKFYEKQYIEQNKNVIVLRRLSYGERKDIIYQINNCDRNKQILLHLDEIDQLWKVEYSKIVINTFVNWSEVNRFIEYLINYKIIHDKCYLMYMVHDFNSICINCNLFNKDHYCNVQCGIEKCQLRLVDKKIQIEDWRKMWERLLQYVDEIRCFSKSSKELMYRVYSNIPGDKYTVVPHNISYIKFGKINGLKSIPLHLGVIGNCNAMFKGKLVVKRMIKKYGASIPITLVGSDYKHYKVKARYVKFMGQYQQRDLQRIIEQEKISCVLFPSVWPETFSYLVSELIRMDIPIICFNYGAQAEKVRKYDKGIVVDNEEELNAILTEMQKMKTWGNFIENYQKEVKQIGLNRNNFVNYGLDID